MRDTHTSPDRVTLGAWLLSVVIGGGNPVGVRLTVLELDPFWAASTRFAAAGAIFSIALLVTRPPVGSWKSLFGATAYGVVNIAASFAFIYWGFRETPAGTGQVLVAIVPLATFALAILHGLERFQWRPLVGALVALGGVIIVFSDQMAADVPLVSLLAVVAGAVCVAEGAVIVKITPRSHPIVTNAVGMLVGAGILVLLSLLTREQWVLPEQGRTWISAVFLVLGGSVAFYWLNVFVLRRWTATATSYAFLLLPVVAVAYGGLFAGESASLNLLMGGTVILLGVWLGGTLTHASG